MTRLRVLHDDLQEVYLKMI